eukprot:TRINITY_DN591_c0_g1_i5.p1 TRINITY_DN591_c0_g1~~TRINITY_DN591_c0_g1_i5.p1  ORF type:complete len:875 (+),score=157.09 TRINITY_DN591_c0_g1_i5:2725-5349(+)
MAATPPDKETCIWTATGEEKVTNGVVLFFDEVPKASVPGIYVMLRREGTNGSFDGFSILSTAGEKAAILFSDVRYFTRSNREHLKTGLKIEVHKQCYGGSVISRAETSTPYFVMNCGVSQLAQIPLIAMLRWDIPSHLKQTKVFWFVHNIEELSFVADLMKVLPKREPKRPPVVKVILSGKHGLFTELIEVAEKIPGIEFRSELEGINNVVSMIEEEQKKETEPSILIDTLGSEELQTDIKKAIVQKNLTDVNFGIQRSFGFSVHTRSSWIDFEPHAATNWFFPFNFLPFRWGNNLSVQEWMFLRTDPLPLGIFRVLFGYLMVDYAFKAIYEGRVYRDHGWSGMRFKYDYMDWLGPDLGEPLCYYNYYLMGVASFGIMIGWPYRLSCLLFIPTFAWHFFSEATHYNNHYYLILTLGFIFLITRADRCLKFEPLTFIKNRFSKKEKEKPQKNVNEVVTFSYFHHFVFRAFVLFVFFYGFVAKLNNDWVSGHVMRAGFEGEVPWIVAELCVFFLAWGGLVFDMVGPLYLCYSPLRPFALFGFIFFNSANMLMFTIGVFPWMMLGSIPLLVDTQETRRFIRSSADWAQKLTTKPDTFPKKLEIFEVWGRRLSRWIGAKVYPQVPPFTDEVYQHFCHNTWYTQPYGTIRPSQPTVSKKHSPIFRFSVCLIFFFVAVIQCVYPLRSVYYHHGTNQQVAWTEHGRKFSWHMMSRHKNCSGVLMAVAEGIGLRHNVTISEKGYNGPIALNAHQLKKLPTIATYVRQLSWKVRKFYENWTKTVRQIEDIDISDRTEDIVDHTKAIKVYADIWCSVNGSPKQPFLDPSYDLSRALPPAVMGDREPWILEQTQFGTEGYASIWPAKTKEELARARGEVVEDDKN